jgi:carbonic anhydrase
MENFDFNKKGAKVLVLSCIDPRYTELLADFLIHNKQAHNDYDLFNLAGSELGVLEKNNWKKVYYEHIDIALKLHKIKELWIFSHMDCGMYKVSLNIKKDEDIDLHVTKLNELEKILKKDYPNLKVKKYVMTDAPEILEVVKP